MVHQGLHVLDLGSGSGRDCYVCSALVGEEGSVTGVDMTDSQNEVSSRDCALNHGNVNSCCDMPICSGACTATHSHRIILY